MKFAISNIIGVGLPKPLEHISQHRLPLVLDVGLQNSVSALLDFSPALAPLHSIPVSYFWKGNAYAVPLCVDSL